MGETRQTEVSQKAEVILDTLGGPGGVFKTPDGIPEGYCVTYVAGQGWELRKLRPDEKPSRPHWSSQLHTWPSERPSYIVYSINRIDRVAFITDGYGRKLLGLPFSQVEALYNEVSRL